MLRLRDVPDRRPPVLRGREVLLRPPQLGDVRAMTALVVRNRPFLQPFEPTRPDRYFTRAGQRAQVRQSIRDRRLDIAHGFGVFAASSGDLIGRIRLSGVERGAFQGGNVGYFIDREHAGRGLMTEAVGLLVDHAFGDLNLHRVEAGVMPRNAASIRVLEKNGFLREGLARRYLRIDGAWEDHHLYAITREDWERVSPSAATG